MKRPADEDLTTRLARLRAERFLFDWPFSQHVGLSIEAMAYKGLVIHARASDQGAVRLNHDSFLLAVRNDLFLLNPRVQFYLVDG